MKHKMQRDEYFLMILEMVVSLRIPNLPPTCVLAQAFIDHFIELIDSKLYIIIYSEKIFNISK